jgi:very-short-patch-repair endonuclease
MKYNPTIVILFFRECGLPAPRTEHRFHPERKWRFDFAFPIAKVAIEVQGGIFIRGAHSRGAQMKKDWEKYNTAACMGWRILQVEPRDLCTVSTANLVKECLGL